MSKQDRQGARTVADLERRLNTRRSFAEVMGLIEKAKEAADEAKEQAKKTQSAVDGIDHEAIWNWLTENGIQQGFFKHEGQVYVNVAYLKGDEITGGKIAAELIDGSTLVITAGSTIAGWNIDNKSIYKTPDGGNYEEGTFMHIGTGTAYRIGGSDEIPGWVFGAGGKWGVTKDGEMYGDDVHLRGEVNATGGNIGDWHIGPLQYISDYYDGIVLYSDMKYESADKTQYGVALTPRDLVIYGRNEVGDAITEPVSWYDIAFKINNLK